jgi:membrane fusion protein, multidrug efflux system
MSHIKKFLPWLIVAAIVIGLALPKLISQREENSAPSGLPAPQLVRTVQVEPRKLEETIRLNGSLLAEEMVEIRSEVTGMLRSIHFEEDSYVEEGQLLLKIDDSELVRQLATIEQRHSFATVQEERQRRLLAEGGTTQVLYDETLNNLNVLKAEKDLLRTRIEKTEIRAPIAGVIGLRHVSPGALIQPATPIASLSQIDTLKVDFSVPERYLSHLRTGMSVTVRVAGVHESFVGTVIAREPQINPATRTVTLRARIKNDNQLLLPGAFASVELVLNEFMDALLVPAAALIPDLMQTTVFVVRDGKVERREVSTGLRTEDKVQITEGLTTEDEVVVFGIQRIRPGQSVRVERISS